MATGPELSQAERLRVQIARMIKGNGLPPEAAQVQSEITTRVQLLGVLDIRLQAKTQTTRGNGTAGGMWRQSFTSFAELNGALAALQTDTLKSAVNLEYAAEQILMETNQGWGLTGSDLPISHLNFDVGAKEKCGQCQGEKSGTCQTCNGQRRSECDQCRGRREKQCEVCFGRGTLATGEDCTTCRKQGMVPCTGCQGQGETTCRTCGGKGQTPCAACEARGETWQQISLNVFAQTNFKMSLGGEYSEDVLQHVRRLRPEHLLDGRAVITPGEKTPGDGVLQVAYSAEFPVIQVLLTVADIPAKFVLLGEKHQVVEATPFLDRLFAPFLDLLRRAQLRQIAAPTALAELAKIRFYRDALSPGKKMQELRRRYPFGISANVMREVPATLQYLLSILTEQPRMLAAFGFNAVLALVMLYVSKTNPGAGHLEFNDIAVLVIVLMVNLGTLLATHFGVTYKMLKSFGITPDLNGIAITSALGKTGFISLGVSFLVCLLAWALR